MPLDFTLRRFYDRRNVARRGATMAEPMSKEQTIVHAACPHDCPDTCAMLVTVENGVVTKVRGDPDHPFTQAGLCVKVSDYERHAYHPDRLLYPMRREGPKAEGL